MDQDDYLQQDHERGTVRRKHMRIVNGAGNLRLHFRCVCVLDEMVNERDDLKDSLKNERDVCDRNRPAEVAGNFPHEQL